LHRNPCCFFKNKFSGVIPQSPVEKGGVEKERERGRKSLGERQSEWRERAREEEAKVQEREGVGERKWEGWEEICVPHCLLSFKPIATPGHLDNCIPC
jgi:hypothetical protein